MEERLLEWYRTNGRDLPWRRTRDPYAILVSWPEFRTAVLSALLS